MDDEVAMATRPIASKSLAAVLDGDAPEFRPEPTVKNDQDKEVAAFFADLYEDETKGPAKSIELFNGIYARNKMLYDTVGTLLGDKSTDELRCTVVSLSACQDLQTTPAGSYLSLFTATSTTPGRAALLMAPTASFIKPSSGKRTARMSYPP